MKKFALFLASVLVLAGCGVADEGAEACTKNYEGDGFALVYPCEWEVLQNEQTGLISIEDSSGTPTLGFSSLSGGFGMAGWEMQREERFVGEGGVEFYLIFNKIDPGFIEEGDWAEGQEFLDNDTTMVMIFTDVVESPMFYRFDKTDPDGEAVMRAILDSFEVK